MEELWVGKSLQGSEIDYGLHSLAFGGVYAKWKTITLSLGPLSQQLLLYSWDTRERFSYEIEGWKTDAALGIQRLFCSTFPESQSNYYSCDPENLGVKNTEKHESHNAFGIRVLKGLCPLTLGWLTGLNNSSVPLWSSLGPCIHEGSRNNGNAAERGVSYLHFHWGSGNSLLPDFLVKLLLPQGQFGGVGSRTSADTKIDERSTLVPVSNGVGSVYNRHMSLMYVIMS